MRRSLAVFLIAIAAVLSAVGCGSNFRADELKANESLFHQLPVFPGARLEQTVSTPYREEEDGPVVGYSTRYDFSLPTGARAEAVASFFARRLQPKWRLAERLDGPVLNFRNGQSFVSINLESWRAHILEIGVDHRT
jgi:hypothetical protein